jgi:hypothetical protein
MDTLNAALLCREVSLSILNAPTIQSIGSSRKILTMHRMPGTKRLRASGGANHRVPLLAALRMESQLFLIKDVTAICRVSMPEDPKMSA